MIQWNRLSLFIVGFCFTHSVSAQDVPQPNVVLMLADDLGAGDLGCYGSPETSTPNLDRLAATGMRFTDFYAASGVCSPSRAATLTGRFSVRAGVYSWIAPQHKMRLRRDEYTIAEALQSSGYATAHIGKWHLGYDLVEGSGNGPNPGDHGFDYWMATGNNASPSHHRPKNFVRNGEAMGEIDGYSCQIVVDEALTWLNQDRPTEEPFFLNLWFHEPHQPVAAPEALNDRHPDVRQPAYYGSIENMDAAVGRLLDYLDERGLRGQTLLLFASDNGSYRTDRRNNRGLTGRKTQLWEGGIREPALANWPGVIPPGRVDATPAGLVDYFPTILDVAGVSLPTDRVLDGVSLVPLLKGGRINRTKPLYWFYNPSRPVCVIRDGSWVLTADPEIDLSRNNMFLESFIGDIKRTALVHRKLFHIHQDPVQQQDLSSRYPERFSQMSRLMDTIHAEVMEEAYDWRLEVSSED